MGRDDERRPSSSQNLYWEAFFSPDDAEGAEFVGFFCHRLGRGSWGFHFFNAWLSCRAAGFAVGAVGVLAALVFTASDFTFLGDTFGAESRLYPLWWPYFHDYGYENAIWLCIFRFLPCGGSV